MSNNYESREQIDRLWDILQKIAMKAYQRDEINPEQRREISNAAGQFYNKILGTIIGIPPVIKEDSGKVPRGINADDTQWSNFYRQELVDMLGREDIHSIADAFLKTKSLLRAVQGSMHGHKRFLFRGQRDISWDLISRKGRALIKSGWIPPKGLYNEHSEFNVLDEELESLSIFKSQWDSLEDVEHADRNNMLTEDSPEWWFRMQHYDQWDGTRLLDVTTSLTSALLFACVDWTSGQIDTKTDGVIYFWPEGDCGNVDDFLLKKIPNTTTELFKQDHEYYRYIINPPHNERSKAQSSAFIWWPKFWEPFSHRTPYYLRVPAYVKEDIVRDLLSMGFGPKEAVRGVKGLQNEQYLRAQLNLPPWNPLLLS